MTTPKLLLLLLSALLIIINALLFTAPADAASASVSIRSRGAVGEEGQADDADFDDDDADAGAESVVPSSGAAAAHRRYTVDDMACDYFEQPLNHFALPKGSIPTYRQRYCYYDGFVARSNDNDNNATSTTTQTTTPVFLYTGNESPLEEYVNNTGLIWELAPRFGALVVFVEHRYEGESLPSPSIPDCMAYSSSVQALADLAIFVERKLHNRRSPAEGEGGPGNLPTTMLPCSGEKGPVVAFGGSYGGMLSAWLRMKYPNAVAGAVAGSAPIWGFPLAVEEGAVRRQQQQQQQQHQKGQQRKIDVAYNIVSRRGFDAPYPPTAGSDGTENRCGSNFLSSQPVIKALGETPEGFRFLSRVFRLCDDDDNDGSSSSISSNDYRNHTDRLLHWIRSPWFDLAEGSFPYPSSYIPYALLHKKAQLPAWPLQAACWKVSDLSGDFGVRIVGDRTRVEYNVTFPQSESKIAVNWDEFEVLSGTSNDLIANPSVAALLGNVRDAVSIWYNVTKDVKCYNVTEAAPNAENLISRRDDGRSRRSQSTSTSNAEEMCRARRKLGSWPALCCNEEMNLIIMEASGLGNDVTWPPTYPRGTATHADVLAHNPNATLDPSCADPDGVFGFSREKLDPWSTFMDVYYGGTRIRSHSNIVFSNGLLDPWSGAGVYAPGMDPTAPDFDFGRMLPFRVKNLGGVIPGLYVQNLTDDSDSMIALIMEYGGHHTDLMYSHPNDPPCVSEARKIEASHIARWIDKWRRDEQEYSCAGGNAEET